MMKSNRHSKVFIFSGICLLLIISSINFISSEGERWCEVTTDSICTTTLKGNILMRLSNTTNAHGALATDTTYSNVLCCNFGDGDTTCDGTNKVLGLSSNTNAHAEDPTLLTYKTNICYPSLSNCYNSPLSVCNSPEELPVIFISSSTNAHLSGEENDEKYNPVCCKLEGGGGCQLSSASWDATEVLEGLEVTMKLEGSSYCGANTQINFSIYDASNNNFKESILGYYPQRQWTTKLFGATTDKNYYFKANITSNPFPTNPVQSGNLKVIYDGEEEPLCIRLGIQRCNDYHLKATADLGDDWPRLACQQDTCNVGRFGPAGENGKCWWDSTSNTCEDSRIINPCGNDEFEPEILEECDGNWDFEAEKWNYYFGKISGNEWEDDTENSCGLYYTGSTGKLACNRPLLDVLNTDQCKLDVSGCSCENENSPVCSNNKRECGEVCDGTDLGNIKCPCGGQIKCAEDCGGYDYSDCTPCDTGGYTCGNNIQEGTEQCDGTDIPGACTDYDQFTGGTLNCNIDCTHNTSSCNPPVIFPNSCGDGIISPGEQCDGVRSADGAKWDFITFGDTWKDSNTNDTCSLYHTNPIKHGNLSCYAPGTPKACTIDDTPCDPTSSGVCNGILEEGEKCDETSFELGLDCKDYDSFTEGTLKCDSCVVNTTGCSRTVYTCNDTIINAGEQCDGIWDSAKSKWTFMNFGSKYKNSTVINTCNLYNSTWSGNLSCYAPTKSKACNLDLTGCTGPGIIVTPGIKSPGVCDYTTLTDDTCEDDGFLDYSWTAKWIPTYPNQPRLSSCVDGDTRIECPAAIPLPFFDWITLIVTLIAIALVYWGIRVVKSRKK